MKKIKIVVVIVGIITIMSAGCIKNRSQTPEASINWLEYQGITSFMDNISQKSLLFTKIWDNIKSENINLSHANEVKFFKSVDKTGATVNNIIGVMNDDTVILSYWVYEDYDTLHGFVNVTSHIGLNTMSVKLFTNEEGQLSEYGEIAGLKDTVIYKGTVLNDSIYNVEWTYLPSKVSFKGSINIQDTAISELIVKINKYIADNDFVNKNLIPIPVEMVEIMAEQVENSKANQAVISAVGAAGVGLALGLIYPPSMWVIGWGASTVYGLINAYVTSH